MILRIWFERWNLGARESIWLYQSVLKIIILEKRIGLRLILSIAINPYCVMYYYKLIIRNLFVITAAFFILSSCSLLSPQTPRRVENTVNVSFTLLDTEYSSYKYFWHGFFTSSIEPQAIACRLENDNKVAVVSTIYEKVPYGLQLRIPLIVLLIPKEKMSQDIIELSSNDVFLFYNWYEIQKGVSSYRSSSELMNLATINNCSITIKENDDVIVGSFEFSGVIRNLEDTEDVEVMSEDGVFTVCYEDISDPYFQLRGQLGGEWVWYVNRLLENCLAYNPSSSYRKCYWERGCSEQCTCDDCSCRGPFPCYEQ